MVFTSQQTLLTNRAFNSSHNRKTDRQTIPTREANGKKYFFSFRVKVISLVVVDFFFIKFYMIVALILIRYYASHAFIRFRFPSSTCSPYFSASAFPAHHRRSFLPRSISDKPILCCGQLKTQNSNRRVSHSRGNPTRPSCAPRLVPRSSSKLR